MSAPELTMPLAQEAYAVWRDEIEPRIKEITGPMAMLVKGLMMGIGPQMPTFFESLDQDQELQDKITVRLRAASDLMSGVGDRPGLGVVETGAYRGAADIQGQDAGRRSAGR